MLSPVVFANDRGATPDTSYIIADLTPRVKRFCNPAHSRYNIHTLTPRDGGQDEGDAVGAYVICKDFVRDRLRAPRGARFPSVSRAGVDELGGNSWKVRAWVDAENAFGPEVRAKWECVVVYAGDGEWRLERLDIEE